jgi:hypothetical protein
MFTVLDRNKPILIDFRGSTRHSRWQHLSAVPRLLVGQRVWFMQMLLNYNSSCWISSSFHCAYIMRSRYHLLGFNAVYFGRSPTTFWSNISFAPPNFVPLLTDSVSRHRHVSRCHWSSYSSRLACIYAPFALFTSCFFLFSCLAFSSILMMEAVCFSETSADLYRTTRRYNT